MINKAAQPFALFLAGTASLSAVEISDLAGDWFITDICSPNALRETYQEFDAPFDTRTSVNSCDFAGPGEFFVSAFYTDPFSTETRSMSLDSAGAASGGESGQITSISQNRLVYNDGMEPVVLYSNTSGDILLTSEKSTDLLAQSLLLKKPPTTTTAELAGDWFIVSMINPNDISTASGGSSVSDVWFTADSSMTSGDITVDGVGGFSGTFGGGPFGGSIVGTSPGEATVNVGGDIFFKANATNSVAVATLGDADESEYIVLVKKPTSINTAELAGTWRVSALRIPTTLTEHWYNTVTFAIRDANSDGGPNSDEILADLTHEEKFDLVRLQLQVASDGSLPNGSFSANPGNKTVSFTYDGDPFTLHPNSDKTFMIGTVVEDDSHELIVFVKTSDTTPATFEESTNLTASVTGSELLLNWNSASNLILQESSTLSGVTWTTVEEANGTDSFTVDLSSGGSNFFRVSEAP